MSFLDVEVKNNISYLQHFLFSRCYAGAAHRVEKLPEEKVWPQQPGDDPFHRIFFSKLLSSYSNLLIIFFENKHVRFCMLCLQNTVSSRRNVLTRWYTNTVPCECDNLLCIIIELGCIVLFGYHA